MIQKYDRVKIYVVDKICTTFGIIAGASLVVATVFMILNIFMRAFNSNLYFIYDLVSMSATLTASFAVAYATFNRGHSIMDIILAHLPHRVSKGFESIAQIICLIVMSFTTYSCGLYAYQKTLLLESTTTSQMPTYIFRWIWTIGCALVLVAFVLELIDDVRMAFGQDVPVTTADLERMSQSNEKVVD